MSDKRLEVYLSASREVVWERGIDLESTNGNYIKRG
jgi:hypothetical protein